MAITVDEISTLQRQSIELIHSVKKSEGERSKRLNKACEEIQKELGAVKEFLQNMKIDHLVAVHLTDQFPAGGVMRPRSNGFFVKLSATTIIKSVLHDTTIPYPRYTLHFTLNHAVASHLGGNWQGKRFAIILPLSTFIERVICLSPVDTWVLGNLTLPPSAEILMSETLYGGLKTSSLKEQRRQYWDVRRGYAKIVPFSDGLPIHVAVENRLREKGFTVVTGGMWDWNLLGAFSSILKKADENHIRLSYQDYFRLLADEGEEKWNVLFNKLSNDFKILIGGASHAGTVFMSIEELFHPLQLVDYKHATANRIPFSGEIEKIIEKFETERQNLLSVKGQYLSKETIAALNALHDVLKKYYAYVVEHEKMNRDEGIEKYGDDDNRL
ncbi:hypothetical protein C4573_05335 [Candidatus Woesearchaeota archaeon]|nr:MAG: hypothetical protein C4573_05335 [Candidatus Woesearchaeota archaeon]